MNVLYIAGKETEGGAVRSLVEMVTEAIDIVFWTSSLQSSAQLMMDKKEERI